MLACCHPADASKLETPVIDIAELVTPQQKVESPVGCVPETEKPGEFRPGSVSTGAPDEPPSEEEEHEEEHSHDAGALAAIDKHQSSRRLSRSELIRSGRDRVVVFGEALDWDKSYDPPVHKKSDSQRERLRTALKKCIFFQTLNVKKMDNVIAAFQKQKYEKDEVIIRQGDPCYSTDPGIFVLDKGTLNLEKADIETKEVKKFPGFYNTPGCVFGELSVVFTAKRSATVKAATKSVLWSLERAAFTNLVQRAEREEKQQLWDFIQKVDLLSGLTNAEQNRLVDAMETRTVDVGEKIISEGEIGDEFFIIKEGRCVAIKGESLVVKEYHEKDYFGELALLNDEPRAASIMAVARTELATLKKDVFKRLLGNLEDILGRRNTYQDEEIDAPGDDSSSEYLDEAEVEANRDAKKKHNRASVLGESWVHDPNWVGPHYPKSDAQRDRLAQVISKSFIFQALNTTDVGRVIDAFREHIPPLNELMIVQGADVTANEPGLFVIESGTFHVYKATDGPDMMMTLDIQPSGCCAIQSKPLNQSEVEAKYGPRIFTYTEKGQYFGELALLYNNPRAATVMVSSNDAALWSISRDVFNNVVKSAMMLEKQRCEKILESVPLLQGLTSLDRSRIADAIKSKEYSAGEYIIRQGETGEDLFILEAGEAVASIDATAMRHYTMGDYFGERALLKNEPRAADIIALSDCRVMTMDRQCFERICGPLDKPLTERMNSYNLLNV